MFEVRRVIEPSIAVFAMKRINDSGLNELKKILDKMELAANSNNNGKFISLNRHFHLSIAKASNNDAIRDIMDTILSYMEEDLWKEERTYYYEESEGNLCESFALHEEIFNAIEKGDEKAVSNKIANHFDYMERGGG